MNISTTSSNDEGPLRKHPVAWGLAGLATIGLGAWLAFGFFGVQTLFLDEVVSQSGPVFDEVATSSDPDGNAPGAPTPANPDGSSNDSEPVGAQPGDDPPAGATTTDTASTPAPGDDGSAPPAEPGQTQVMIEYSGDFVADAHPTEGQAVVLSNGTDQRFLRFENFKTDNGPDLNVYLVNSSTGDTTDFVDLGDLSGNVGDQNYEIPVGVDLSTYDTAVIWCVRFGVGFGEASLISTSPGSP